MSESGNQPQSGPGQQGGQPSSDDLPTTRARVHQPPVEPTPVWQQSAPPPPHPVPAGSGWPGPPQAPLRGPDGKKVIATLPPLDVLEPPLALSETTGQPRRNPVMLVGAGLLYAASAAGALAFAKFWWDAINITHFTTSARLLTWTDPRPGSWQSIVWVCVIAVMTCAVVAAPAIAAFQAWNGHRWSRIAGLVAVGVALLAILLNTWALVAIGLAVVGAAILWLKPVSAYFDQWAAFRAEEPRHPQAFDRVRYGRLSRYASSDR